ncbi:hypothetical protein FQ185_16965 [Pseudomonas sp. ANT_H12B]|nr:hypothetical protein FQ185_16965 [Pseudomonas sp. ANT_H12B]
MGGILVGVLAAVRLAHQIQDLIIVVLPVCPVQAQSRLGFFSITRGNRKIGMTGLTSGAQFLALKQACDAEMADDEAREGREAIIANVAGRVWSQSSVIVVLVFNG